MVSLSVVYLPAVLVVSITWGGWLGIGTAVVSAAAFNFFHLPPLHHFEIRESSNWVALVTFLVVAGLASSVAELTRARAREAEARRREADLAAEMARLLLRGDDLAEALPTAAARLAQALELNSAAIEMEALEGDERGIAFPLRDGTSRLGTLLVGADTSEASLRRLQERVVPALEALLSAAALEREGLLGGVVETAALRRADTVKTALLRAVSHDLRSPLTAISAAGEAVGSPSLSGARAPGDGGGHPGGGEEALAAGRQPARPVAFGSGRRGAPPGLDLCRGVDPRGACRAGRRPGGVQPVDRPRAAAREGRSGADGACLRERAGERAAALGRAPGLGARARRAQPGAGARRPGVEQRRRGARPGGRQPPAGRPRDRARGRSRPGHSARAAGARVRALLPRRHDRGGHRGSGLGLAIARGFTEASSGSLHVESLPGQGASFVFELPLEGPSDGRRAQDAAEPDAQPALGGEPLAPRGAGRGQGA